MSVYVDASLSADNLYIDDGPEITCSANGLRAISEQIDIYEAVLLVKTKRKSNEETQIDLRFSRQTSHRGLNVVIEM